MNTSSDFSGIPVGFYLNLELAPKMSVRTELNWLKYGFSARFGWFHTDMDVRFTMGQSNVFTDEYPDAKFKSTLVTLGMGYAS